MENTLQTVPEFIAQMDITATCTPADNNPNMDSDTPMDHWRVVLTSSQAGRVIDGRASKMTVYFSRGSGHNGKEPTAAEVLDCLASDAASVDNAQSFEDWAGDFGYDVDSRKALRTFNVCKRQSERLRKFLGYRAYEELLWKTERL